MERGGLSNATVELPRLLLASRDARPRPDAEIGGVLLHDVGLLDVVRLSAAGTLPVAVDADTVEGLAPDEAAIAFLVERLRLPIVITRRPALAARAGALGCVALLHVHGLDSTGWERAMAAHPGPPVGTAVSPGLILTHLDAEQLRSLPRPVLAYGLIRRSTERDAAFAAGADSVVVS
ncbi:MAG TPA: glycerol-3-phosphate responsive antiterminator [Candidatus Dormibacteraeota bacterium]